MTTQEITDNVIDGLLDIVDLITTLILGIIITIFCIGELLRQAIIRGKKQ